MTKKRFSEILKEYGYTDRMIRLLWEGRPLEHKLFGVDEDSLRITAKGMAPLMAQPTNLN